MPTAILSEYDKTNPIDFANDLAELGWTLPASGGTVKLLHESGSQSLPVRGDHRQAGCKLRQGDRKQDIGSVPLIRAAAKNHERVTLACETGCASSWITCLRFP